MKLLVYTDGGPTADQALAFAAAWTQALQAELAVITVRSETHAMEAPPPLGRGIAPADWHRLPQGLQVLTDAARKLAAHGVMPPPTDIVIRETPHSHFFNCPFTNDRPITFHEHFGPFIESLNREIDRHHFDLLIIAPPRRSRLRRLVLGDTTRKLALGLHTSVLIVREGTPDSRLVICADGSASAQRVFPLLQKMLACIDRPVELLWVQSPDVGADERSRVETRIAQVQQWLTTRGRESHTTRLEGTHPAETIAAAAGPDALVMMGASLRHDVYRQTRGSLPMRLLSCARASILLVKAPPEADPGADAGLTGTKTGRSDR